MNNQILTNSQMNSSNKYLYQRLDNSFGIPFTLEIAKKFGMSQHNTWTTGTAKGLSEASVIMDLLNDKAIGEQIKDLIYYNKSDNKINNLITFINSKRFLPYEIEGEKYFMFIPSAYMETPFEYPRELLNGDYTKAKITHYNEDPLNRIERTLTSREIISLKSGTFKFEDKDEVMILDGSLVPTREDVINNININKKSVYKTQIIQEKIVVSDLGYRIIIDTKQSLNYYSSLLFQAMLSLHKYKICEDVTNKAELLKEFISKIDNFRMAINKKVFSKDFKNHYKFNFKGYSGVVLTGNVGIDEIEIPKHVANKFNLEIGDKVLVYRDPVQNIFVYLTIVGFTQNEIRMNPITILLVDGDCDGDKIQVIPGWMIFEQVEKHSPKTDLNNLINELENIIPSRLLSGDSIFQPLTRLY